MLGSVDLVARVVSIVDAVLLLGTLVISVLAFQRSRHRITVTLRLGTYPGPPKPLIWAVAVITTVGGPTTVEDIEIVWDDPKPMPNGFGVASLTHADLNLWPGVDYDFARFLGIQTESGPPVRPRRLEDGTTEIMPIGRVTVPNDWGSETDQSLNVVRLRAHVRVAGTKNAIRSNAQSVSLRPKPLPPEFLQRSASVR